MCQTDNALVDSFKQSKTLNTFLFTGVLLFFFLILMADFSTAADNAPYEEGQFLIQVYTDSPSSLSLDFKNVELKPVRLLSRRMNIWLYEYKSAGMNKVDQESLLESVRGHRDVAVAQFNHKVTMRATIPNDPSFGSQWCLNNTGQTGGTPDADIDAPEAWDSTTGGMSADGDQIVVAIIDGGFELAHTDLVFFKNTLETPGNGIDDDGNGYIDDYDGWNAYSNNGNVPNSNHGTHVSGIAAAHGNNSIGVSGVNWGAQILPVAGSSSNEATVVAAYGYVLEVRTTYNETDGAAGAFVVSTNSSFGVDFGDPANFPIWCAMYDSMGNAGIISCAATANLNIDIDVQGDVPTACASNFLLSVTNTTHNDTKNSGAAYGLTTIDLGAPGTSILSTTQGGGYGNLTGTSMATPQVTGALALMYSAACPGFITAYKSDPATYALIVRDAILDGTDPIAALSGITVTGGRLNVFNSVNIMRTLLCGSSITHTPLGDTKDTLNDYEVICTITSDTTLAIGDQLLHYDAGSGYELDTLETTGGLNEYHAFIPAQSAGTNINYFLTALDGAGNVDTTAVFSFKVIDYSVSIIPDTDSALAAAEDTAWYALTITNSGVLEDSYDLVASGESWSTEIWDETGTFTVSSTPNLMMDSSFNIMVSVAIPVSLYGDKDTVNISATSTTDVSQSDTSILVSTSAGEPVALPLFDEFPMTSFNAAYWVEISNATIGSGGINEPSASFSLNLNGNTSGADTVVSQIMDLSGETSAIVRYYYERTGGGDSPENGDDMFSEYLDSMGNWQIIEQHLGSGPDMTDYEEVFFTLPSSALHKTFRLRFRCVATAGAFDDWFVDDIFVGAPPSYAMAMEPSFQSQYGSSGDTASYLFTIFNNGLLADDYTLYVDNNDLPVIFFDETGITQITSTGIINSGDSVNFIAKVAISGSYESSDADTADIFAVSSNDTTVNDQAVLITISSGPPGSFPWYEPFPDSSVSAFRWIINTGGEISTEGLNPPSAPFSLNLDGSNDTLVSQTINLASLTNLVLSYYWERGGSGNPPETGDTLKVDYKNNLGNWTNLRTYLGQSPAMTNFESEVILLPGDAAHGAFQLRLSSRGSGSGTDDWYVDDIRVDYEASISVAPGSVSENLDQDDSTEVSIVIDNLGDGKLNWSATIVPTFKTSDNLASLWESGQAEPARRNYPDGFFDYEDIKGSSDYRKGFDVNRGFGGPDLFGYYWIDSDESGGPEFNWVDVSGTGTNVVAGLDDDNFIGPYPIGFDFPFYDSTYKDIYIGSNGIIGFSDVDMDSRFKAAIPTAATPNNFIAWMWDDLDPTNANNPTADVYVDTTGGKCVIQFNNYPEYAAAAGDLITAEVILYPDGTILLQYLDIADGFDSVSNTIGIEDESGSDGLEVVFLGSYAHDSLALKFVKPFQWYELGTSSGEVQALSSDTLPLKMRSGQLETGTYNAQLIIANNDPDSIDNPTVIPVELNVSGLPPFICGDVDNNGEFQGILELNYLVNFVFRSGPPPPIIQAADIDGIAGFQGILELNYMVNHVFRGGPAPVCQ